MGIVIIDVKAMSRCLCVFLCVISGLSSFGQMSAAWELTVRAINARLYLIVINSPGI